MEQLSHINEGESRDDLGVPAKKRSGSARVPSPKKATASRRSDPSRKEDAARAERHAIYKKMLKRAPTGDDSFYGFCTLLRVMWNDDIIREVDITELPELRAHKPKSRPYGWPDHWWDPGEWKPRIKALKAAIKASAPALGIGAKPKAARLRAGAKRSGAKPGRKAATPRKK